MNGDYPPSHVTDNGGKNGGNLGGKMAMFPVCPQLVPSFVTRREKDASIDSKDATSSPKVATSDEKVASLEPKDKKVNKKA